METSVNPSSKPEVTPKKISNRRAKTKLTPIQHKNSDSSNHTEVHTKTGDLNEIDSPTDNINMISSSNTHESNNISMSTTTNMNDSTPSTVEHNKNNDPRLIDTIHSDIVTDKDNTQICASTVNDRKLFMDCVDGDLDKYKHCVKIESSSLRDVWIGVTARYSSIKFYICVKNSDNSMNTFFMDSIGRQQFESALVSFVQTTDPNLLLQSDGLGQSSLEYSKVDGNLVINEVLCPTKMIIFDNAMIYSYWGKKWTLERFIEYLQKKRDMIHYCQHIFATFANYEKTNVTKNDFIDKFENSKPPNYIFTSTEMWNFFNKKFLGN